MHKEFNHDALRRLQALIARETGAPLGEAAAAEAAAILRGADGPEGVPADDSVVAAPREVTILLADLRGFTALSASLPAGVVIAALNRCLAVLSEVVFKHQGAIDKFMGDSIMVLFGAPTASDDDVDRALMCAVEMQMAMRDLNLAHMRERLPEVFLGIGVNTGTVMAGRFGSDVYSEYTVIGEEVNLASRIEAFSLRGQVLISEATYQRCWGLVSASAPMQVYVKGRQQPVGLRELVAIPSRKLKVPRQEFRRSHRVDTRLPCLCQRIQDKIIVPQIVHTAIRDIGYHGLLVEMTEPLALHSEIKLEFDLTLVEYRATDVYARVITLKPEGEQWLAGLEFTSISPECHAKVQMFVQLLVAAR
ncbi:family 3 adenylate cyclase [Acidovorax sp. CF316]|uniref:adenylate/guanylate cyclase domain-containing protein n=1 Tax=Acidovorax sp. CF316 TaxID=1144317 RepID=UPI00026BC3D4|nr:adenylate/guanylate cyclase domain-containing protein [Acidovorax sp. CF316]EJE50221.1 family 3 adenylate cyclase [Acidovorax sp. CF316]